MSCSILYPKPEFVALAHPVFSCDDAFRDCQISSESIPAHRAVIQCSEFVEARRGTPLPPRFRSAASAADFGTRTCTPLPTFDTEKCGRLTASLRDASPRRCVCLFCRYRSAHDALNESVGLRFAATASISVVALFRFALSATTLAGPGSRPEPGRHSAGGGA